MPKDTKLEESLDVLRDPKTSALERPIGARPLAVPLEVSIDGAKLRWRTRGNHPDVPLTVPLTALPQLERDRLLGKPSIVSPGRGMLERFVRLHRQTDEMIRDFASRWGALGICEHSLPHTHWPLSPWDIDARPPTEEERQQFGPPEGYLACYQLMRMNVADDADAYRHGLVILNVNRNFCQPLGNVEEGGRGGWEPLERWRFFSEEAATILRTAASLHLDGTGEARVPTRDAIRLLYGTVTDDSTTHAEIVDWRWVRQAVDRWLAFGNVRPYLHDFGKGRLAVGYGTSDSPTEADLYISRSGYFFDHVCGLFGALATQLLLVVTNSRGIANCNSCGLPFFVDRKPAPGRLVWCWDPECRKAKDAHAKRSQRERDNTRG